jgi:peptide/nickel transport system substrate-binding protein
MRYLFAAALTVLLMSACARAPEKAVAPSSVVDPSAADSAAGTTSAATEFPYPGPFKLKESKLPDGSVCELWEARGEPGTFGGALTVCTIGSGPKTFNFWAGSDADSSGVGYLMFERLVDVDAWTGTPYPRLARSIDISPNKLDYTISLRKGLQWSDGKPITADDITFTINTIVGEKLGQHGATLHDVLSVDGKFPSVQKIDDLTVEFHTPVPFSPFLQELAGVPIAPKHAVEPVIRKSRNAFESLWSVNCDPKEIPVSGRFKIERYVPGQRVEFVRNSLYSFVDKSGSRLPYLDRFIFSIVPDQNTVVLKFYAKELDLLDIRSIRGQDAAIMKQRETTDNFRMFNLGPNDGTMFFMVNMCRRKNPKTGKHYVEPLKQKWFNNHYFRQAISHAIDRRRLIDNIMKGVGIELFTPESTASVFFNKNLKPYPQDLNLATELLAKGGFVKRKDRLFDEDGNPVEFTLNTNAGNTTREATCVLIANNLQKLGMKVNLQPIDFNILVNKVENSLDWDAVVMGLTGSKLEVYDGANVWKSDGRLHLFDQRLPSGENGKVAVTDAREWERRIDRLLDLGATTFDQKLRHQYYDEYQKIVYDQLPLVYLYSSLDLTAARNTIGNYKPTPLGVTYTPLGSMHNLEEIFIRKPVH